MAEVRFVIESEPSSPLRVFIEPWADDFTIPAGERVAVTFVGDPPTGAPHAVLEWHDWGLLIWAEIGMVDRSVTAQDGTVMIATSPELVRLLEVAEHATFGHPLKEVGRRRRRWFRLRR